MFCPNCGKSNQKSETYCRQCGEFILNPSGKFYPLSILFGGEGNPEKQLNFSVFINLATTLASITLIGFLIGYYDAHYERTGESTPTVIFAVYAFLALIAFWQFLSFIIGFQMKSKFKRRKHVEENKDTSQANVLSAAETKELLPQAEMKNIIDASVTENTTKNLKKIPRQ